MEEASDCHKFYFVFLTKNKKHILKLPLKFGWHYIIGFGNGVWTEAGYIIPNPGNPPHFSQVGI